MYKSILLPTDGSRLSEEAARAGIALARALGARVTALHVVTESADVGLDAWAHARPDFSGKLATTLGSRGEVYVENVREAARLSGVPCECRVSRGPSPHAGIIEEAKQGEHDLIVMASHGRDEAEEGTFGSETLKVLKLGDTPVLVHHDRRRPAVRAG